MAVTLVQGSARNIKLTTQEDMILAEDTFAGGARTPLIPDVRTGTGFDVHRFAPGDAVWLCGVKIPFTQKLEGHSDADVGLHALTDAILGALGDGDIGSHFPPSDMTWKGAASHLFLTHAASLAAARGARITNVDVTILCEAPKISPHRDGMRAAIADILNIDISRVGVKATTTEGLGFTGRREGIAAMASATLVLPGTV
jgi:2-C-methyl-D-erythritol 4-phosphate cytidylyltransferase / 2-C-methyl-D-erythritol 2,4-cyclodiphosphate synthase